MFSRFPTNAFFTHTQILSASFGVVNDKQRGQIHQDVQASRARNQGF